MGFVWARANCNYFNYRWFSISTWRRELHETNEIKRILFLKSKRASERERKRRREFYGNSKCDGRLNWMRKWWCTLCCSISFFFCFFPLFFFSAIFIPFDCELVCEYFLFIYIFMCVVAVSRPKGQHSAPRGGPPRSWTNAELTEALHHVWNKKMTTSQASRLFGIPYNSLLMYVRGKYGKSLNLEQLRKGCISGPPIELLTMGLGAHTNNNGAPSKSGHNSSRSKQELKELDENQGKPKKIKHDSWKRWFE